MLQVILRRVDNYYESGNRWWLPLICGLLYAFAHPPFNGLLHPIFMAMPFFAPFAMIPLFYFATRKPRRRALWHSYLYCAALMLGQYYWIGFSITALGKTYWIGLVIIMLLLAVALIALGFGAYTFLAAVTFRFLAKRLPRMYVFVFPAVWVLMEYGRTFTDLAFPWSYIGYGAAGVLPLAQFSAVTGVWGLSYLAVIGGIVIWELLRAVKDREEIQKKWKAVGIWAAMTAGIFIWGVFRMNMGYTEEKTSRVAIMQSYMDQFNWSRNSLDTAVTVSDSMIRIAVREDPEVMIFPESAILCYLDRRPDKRSTVLSWVDNTKIPIILGALHWDENALADGSGNVEGYDVYNTAFMAKDGMLTPYHKMALVPFSERMPFQELVPLLSKIPILSRVDLSGGNFKRGRDETIFHINGKLNGAPLICYEIAFPQLVRRRLLPSTHILVNITNDGWFGRTSGPYQHAAMSQMRSIENGISLARSANSGISMFVDPYGRVLSRTRLYTREILVEDVPTYRLTTFYARFGDWFLWVCAGLTAAGFLACMINKKRMGEITNPLLVEEQGLAAAKP